MHALIRSSRSALRKAEALPRNGGYVARHYAKQIEDFNIVWNRPVKIRSIRPEKSGDGGVKLDIKPTDLASKYSMSKELEDANDNVKNMFTLQFLPQKITFQLRTEKILDMVKRHQADWGSPEAKIARMTNEILYLQEYVETHKYNRQIKHYLKELIEKRNKHIDFLRKWDYKKYEWILEKLNIIFKKTPIGNERVTRKKALRTLTQDYCDKFQQEKLDVYRTFLQKQQLSFYQEKAEKFAYIRNVQLEYGVQPTVTEEEIDKILKKVEELSTQNK